MVMLLMRYQIGINTKTKFLIYFSASLVFAFQGGIVAIIRLSEPIVWGTLRTRLQAAALAFKKEAVVPSKRIDEYLPSH